VKAFYKRLNAERICVTTYKGGNPVDRDAVVYERVRMRVARSIAITPAGKAWLEAHR
jgi:hypothetical protein